MMKLENQPYTVIYRKPAPKKSYLPRIIDNSNYNMMIYQFI
jgi:hypothetical protein